MQTQQLNPTILSKTPITDFLTKIGQQRCPVCYTDYNLKKRTPMSVCSSQHSICYKCLKNIKKTTFRRDRACPICKQKMHKKAIKKNRLLFQMVATMKQAQKKEPNPEDINLQQQSKTQSKHDYMELQNQSEQSQPFLYRNGYTDVLRVRLNRLQRTMQSLYGDVDAIQISDTNGQNTRRFQLVNRQTFYNENSQVRPTQVSLIRNQQRQNFRPNYITIRDDSPQENRSTFSLLNNFFSRSSVTVPTLVPSRAMIPLQRMTAPVTSGIRPIRRFIPGIILSNPPSPIISRQDNIRQENIQISSVNSNSSSQISLQVINPSRSRTRQNSLVRRRRNSNVNNRRSNQINQIRNQQNNQQNVINASEINVNVRARNNNSRVRNNSINNSRGRTISRNNNSVNQIQNRRTRRANQTNSRNVSNNQNDTNVRSRSRVNRNVESQSRTLNSIRQNRDANRNTIVSNYNLRRRAQTRSITINSRQNINNRPRKRRNIN